MLIPILTALLFAFISNWATVRRQRRARRRRQRIGNAYINRVFEEEEEEQVNK